MDSAERTKRQRVADVKPGSIESFLEQNGEISLADKLGVLGSITNQLTRKRGYLPLEKVVIRWF